MTTIRLLLSLARVHATHQLLHLSTRRLERLTRSNCPGWCPCAVSLEPARQLPARVAGMVRLDPVLQANLPDLEAGCRCGWSISVPQSMSWYADMTYRQHLASCPLHNVTAERVA